MVNSEGLVSEDLSVKKRAKDIHVEPWMSECSRVQATLSDVWDSLFDERTCYADWGDHGECLELDQKTLEQVRSHWSCGNHWKEMSPELWNAPEPLEPMKWLEPWKPWLPVEAGGGSSMALSRPAVVVQEIL